MKETALIWHLWNDIVKLAFAKNQKFLFVFNFHNFIFFSKMIIFLIPLCQRYLRCMFRKLSMEFLWKSTFVVLVQFYQNFMILAIFCSLWGSYFLNCGSGKQTKSRNFFLKIFSWTSKWFLIPQVVFNYQKNVRSLHLKWNNFLTQFHLKKVLIL